MIGIDPAIMCHRLNIDPTKKGVRQKHKSVSGERVIALKEEVDRLLLIGREANKRNLLSKWLANPF